MNININTNKTDFRFINRINCLYSHSGSGKTYTLSLISEYCSSKNINCYKYDYNALRENRGIDMDKRNRLFGVLFENDIVFFDNFELYADDDLIERINASENTTFFVVCNNFDYIAKLRNDVGIYGISYKSDCIKSIKL